MYPALLPSYCLCGLHTTRSGCNNRWYDKSIIKLRESNQPQSALDSFDLPTRTGKKNIVMQNIITYLGAKVKSIIFFRKAGTMYINLYHNLWIVNYFYNSRCWLNYVNLSKVSPILWQPELKHKWFIIGRLTFPSIFSNFRRHYIHGAYTTKRNNKYSRR